MDEEKTVGAMSELCSAISLSPEAVACVEKVRISEEEYYDKRKLFREDREAFWREILGRSNYRILFLYYYLRFACDAYDDYLSQGLTREIYFDTFRDIEYWCANCFDRYGEYGIADYEWIAKLMAPEVIRLGRLEYEAVTLKRDISVPDLFLPKGKKIIFVHIPQGSRLDDESVGESLKTARQRYGVGEVFACYSWLMYPGIMNIIPRNSNIALFQKRFDIKGADENDRQAEERVFGQALDDPAHYPERTALQRNMKQYLLSGHSLGCGFGILK